MRAPYYNNPAQEVVNKFAIDCFYMSTNRVYNNNLDYEGESHDFWEVLYVDDGEVEVTEDGNVYLLGKGDIIFHAPMEFHRIKSYGGTTQNIINLSFGSSGDYPQDLLDGVFHLDEARRKEFIKISDDVQEWLKITEKNKFSGQEISARLISFMFRLSRIHQQQNNKIPNDRVRVYKRLVEIMNQEVFNNISIAQVAEKMFLSVSYVKVLFNRYGGVSPKQYYSTLQVNEAAKMLAEGKNVREIAERLNFSSPSYFSVFFKKHMGMTPKQYKNLKR